ncbi:hypothetical protein DNTS_023862 [Danionella cerebrum]|uniref:RRM domain-containing protein n=1 Tax=Danionella cerebrum TaxID=2873325 RepID=A0A553PWZ8_9TELE|nr:hypothetical protein DNTS_023862 [Danionella translucida]
MCFCHVFLSLLNPSDVTDTDDATCDNSKTLSCEDGLAEPEAGVELEPEAEPEVGPEPENGPDEELEAETEVPSMEATKSEAAPETLKEVEDDNISVTIQAEDAITLDVDGDDLLEPGKHVKLPDSESDKGFEESEATAVMGQEANLLAQGLDCLDEDKRDDGLMSDAAKKDGKEASKKGESGDKEKDSPKKAPSSTVVTGQAKSSSKDHDGKTTKGDKADLKNLFGKYGKVISAKVVTNARSPGAKCYGLVTMSSSVEVARCIAHLNHTELHGQQISVDRVKTDPFKKDFSKKEGEDKTAPSKISAEKRTPAKPSNKAPVLSKKEEKKTEKPFEKDNKDIKKDDAKNKKADPSTSSAGIEAAKKNEKKHGRMKESSENSVSQPVQTAAKFHQPSSSSQDGWEVSEAWSIQHDEPTPQLVDFTSAGRRREVAERERREREHMRLMHERIERENIMRERQRLEMERQKLERERMERERLERERIRIEQERRKEADRLVREREELKRQQEHLRFEQVKRNNLKRGRDIDQRRNRYVSEAEAKKNRPVPRREGSGFERYPKSFEPARRPEALPPPRPELRDGDRRDIRGRDERRQGSMPDRAVGVRAPAVIPPSRTTRDISHTIWKKNGGIGTKPGEIRYGAVQMHTSREAPIPVIRGVTAATHARSSFSSRDGGRPVVIGEQVMHATCSSIVAYVEDFESNAKPTFSPQPHFSSGRQVVVERQGPAAYTDNRLVKICINRIVQITNVSMASSSGGFKSFKGRF